MSLLEGLNLDVLVFLDGIGTLAILRLERVLQHDCEEDFLLTSKDLSDVSVRFDPSFTILQDLHESSTVASELADLTSN